MRENIIQELSYQYSCPNNISKDIILIVHDQYELVKMCIESLCKTTTNYNLFIWDNNSNHETRDFLESCNYYMMIRSKENRGFIYPNNTLAYFSESPYIILLNTDVILSEGWSEALIGNSIARNDAIVGYQGGVINRDCLGIGKGHGSQIDYVCGWCMCIPRKVYKDIGLFDDNLQFAYGEDSDFCLQAKKNGHDVYALYLPCARHVGGATINEVMKTTDIMPSFISNHEYLKKKWEHYLEHDRVLVKQGEIFSTQVVI